MLNENHCQQSLHTNYQIKNEKFILSLEQQRTYNLKDLSQPDLAEQ